MFRKLNVVTCLCLLVSDTFTANHERLCSKYFKVLSDDCGRPIDAAIFKLPGPGSAICTPLGNGEYIVKFPCGSSMLVVGAHGYIPVDHTDMSALGRQPVLLPRDYAASTSNSVTVQVDSVCGSDLTGVGLKTSPTAARVETRGRGTFQVYTCDLPVSITAVQDNHQTQTVQAMMATQYKISLPCKVAGGWSAWLSEPCTRTCGGGFIFRFRSCDSPLPANGGLHCIGPSRTADNEPCNNFPCPGGWSEWVFTTCSATCGGGIQTRVRQCVNGGILCVGDPIEVPAVPCNEQSCPVDGGVTAWGLWTGCSCNVPREVSTARSRTRTCTNPEPAFGGAPCTEPLIEYVDCLLSTPCAYCTTGCCNGSVYQHIPEREHFINQVHICEHLGGRLVEVNCEEENTIVTGLITASGETAAHIMGMLRIDGVLQWMSGDSLTFTDWRSETFPRAVDNCGIYRRIAGEWIWRTNNCFINPAVCEFQLA